MSLENPNNSFASPSQVPVTPTPAPVIENYQEHLVGEDKKYKTVEDALKGAAHAQTHIERLEREAQEREAKLQAELAANKSAEDLLKAIDAKREQSIVQNSTPPQQNLEGLRPADLETPSATEPSKFDETKMEELIRQYVSQDREQRTKEANFERAVRTLDGKFGSRDATNQAVEKVAQTLGVNSKFLADMAEQSPDGFLKLMDSSATPTGAATGITPPSVNSQALTKNASLSGKPQPGTYRWYQDLKQSDPRAYRRMYSQQMKEMQDNPEKFYERAG